MTTAAHPAPRPEAPADEVAERGPAGDAAPPSIGQGRFPAISDYAFLSDCENTCLIATDGSVEWLCLPRPDSASVFGAMLDRSAGSFRIGPAAVSVPAARRYIPGTLVLETTWQTDTGWIVVKDALVISPWHDVERRSLSHRRAPTDDDAAHILLRTIECTHGTVELAVECEPAFDYSRDTARWDYDGQGYSSVVATGAGSDPGSLRLRLNSSLRFGLEGQSAVARTTMAEGDHHFVALAFGSEQPPSTAAQAEEQLTYTESFWRNWLSKGTFPDHPWRSHLQISALTLKGLTHSPSGALLAAATTSLPETPGGERNWDYRYSWVRDATFALWGLYTLGFDREADDFFYFIHDACAADPAALQVMYGVGGETDLTESTLDHLTGYLDSRPVRIGNGAHDQRQHDVWGVLLDSIYLHSRSRNRMPDELWPIVQACATQTIQRWRSPDAGMWEMRGEPQHFVASKVMCWVAMDRAARLAAAREEREYAQQWAAVADEIHADVLANGVNDDGIFVQSYGSDALDASVLLLPLVRFLPAGDERIRATVLAIADNLTEDGMVLRYRTDETDDGLTGAEGAFTICSFWLVSALVEIGEPERAERLCSTLLAHASPLGLFSEEIEPATGRHLGNTPQAFTHLALINAVAHVISGGRRGEPVRFVPASRRR